MARSRQYNTREVTAQSLLRTPYDSEGRGITSNPVTYYTSDTARITLEFLVERCAAARLSLAKEFQLGA